jgi:hypothetical protein
MKSIFLKAFVVILFFSSCEKYLDKSPEMGVTDDEVYAKYHSFRGALDKVYVYDQDFFHGTFNGYTFALGDEGITTATGDPANSVNNGNYMGSGSVEIAWNLLSSQALTSINVSAMPIAYMAFKNLRTVNICIERIDDITDASPRQKEELLGQAYFYRAWNYFQLIRRFGGFFKFDKAFTSDSEMDLPRLSYAESTEWLVSDLDRAYGLLPDSWPVAEKGRVTKAAALALKSMALLYAASPNMNANLQYNQGLSERAAKAAWETIQYVNTSGTHRLLPGKTADEYSKIFYNKTQLASDEAIFYKMTNTNSVAPGIPQASSWNASFILNSRESANVHLASPTQNFVDLFETKNGLPIGQDPQYNDQDPYSNRDPRFYYDILYNNLEWNWSTPTTHTRLEFWEANTFDSKISADLQALPQYYPRSPYAIRKWLPESANKWQNDYNYYMQSIHIRFAQVYLDFAEAANEAYGPTTKVPGTSLSALDAINIIRDRVGAVPVRAEFTTSKEVFRNRIYNERTVELCFENHRWHDIRRWRIAQDVLKDIKKAVITRTGANQYSFRYVSVASGMQRVFAEKHYWYPIPQAQMDMLSVFKQNPGW